MQVQVEVKVTSFDTNTLCKGRMTVTINVRENRMDNPEAQLGTRHKKRQTKQTTDHRKLQKWATQYFGRMTVLI